MAATLSTSNGPFAMLLSLFKTRSRTECEVRLHDGTRFRVRPGETLLDAALGAGLDAPYNCRVGACRTCRCEVVEGKAKSLVDRAYVLEPHDLQRGAYLACQTQPLSDLVLRWEMGHRPESGLAAKVSGLVQLTPRVWRVSLITQRALQASPGQYVGVRVPQGDNPAWLRPYSIVALAPHLDGSLLHLDVARHAGGRMSTWLTSADAIGQAVQLAGPFGDCVSGPDPTPLAAAGAGSGIGAACGALMESHARHPGRPTLLLAYGVQVQDLYGADELAASARRHGARHLSLAWAEHAPTATSGTARGRAPLGLDAIGAWAASWSRTPSQATPDARVLLYGPGGFIDACLPVLHDMGFGAERIRFDRYQSPSEETT